MWRHSVSTWRHEVTELTIHILACRCARKMILFLFLWYFESWSSKLLLVSHLYNAVTSWRHVMTSQNLIYLSQLVDVLESWFFFCFYGILKRHTSLHPSCNMESNISLKSLSRPMLYSRLWRIYTAFTWMQRSGLIQLNSNRRDFWTRTDR